MPTASTVASIIVALAVIALVVRWPRLPADRRMLERRAHGLEALATVVARSAEARSARPSQPTSTGVRAPERSRRNGTDTSAPTPAATPDGQPERTTGAGGSADTGGTDAVTLLGPVDAGRSPARHHLPRRPRSARPTALPGHGHPGRSTPAGPAEIVRLGAGDVPPDDDLSETTDAFDTWPAADPASPSRPLTGAPPAPAPPPSDRRSPRPPATPVPGAAPSAAAARRPAPPHRAPRHRRVRVATAVVVAMVVAGSVVAAVRPGTTPSDTSGENTAALSPSSTPTSDTSPPPTLTPSGTIGDVVAFAAATPLTLDLAAGAPSWIRVQTETGAVLFEGTLEAGQQTSVRADEPVRIRLGNPAGVLAAADGGLLDHPRIPGQPLTLTLG